MFARFSRLGDGFTIVDTLNNNAFNMTYQKLDYEEPKVELFPLRAHGYSILLNFSLTGEVDEFGEYEPL